MSVMKELQYEITRLARKEVRKELEPVKRVNAAQRGLIANLRRDVTELQREVTRLQKAAGKVAPVKDEPPAQRFWISGKGVVSLRNKLQLTQAQFAVLAGVSAQSVVKWEATAGKINFRRQETADRIQIIRGMTKKQAWSELE